MVERRLVSAILDQVAVASAAVETLVSGARRSGKSCAVELELVRASEDLLRACGALVVVERLLSGESDEAA